MLKFIYFFLEVIYEFSIVLNFIKSRPVPVKDLYERTRPFLNDATDFMLVMDCLYALRAADINDKGEVFLCLSK